MTHEEEEDMSCVPYANVVISLIYTIVCTRPKNAFAMGLLSVLSKYMSKTKKEHWTTMKRVFRYFHGTTGYKFCFQGRP